MTILDMITTSRRDVTGMMMMMMMIDDDDDYDDLEYDLCEYCIAISWGLAYATGMEGMKPKKIPSGKLTQLWEMAIYSGFTH